MLSSSCIELACDGHSRMDAIELQLQSNLEGEQYVHPYQWLYCPLTQVNSES